MNYKTKTPLSAAKEAAHQLFAQIPRHVCKIQLTLSSKKKLYHYIATRAKSQIVVVRKNARQRGGNMEFRELDQINKLIKFFNTSARYEYDAKYKELFDQHNKLKLFGRSNTIDDLINLLEYIVKYETHLEPNSEILLNMKQIYENKRYKAPASETPGPAKLSPNSRSLSRPSGPQ
jgi:hypothetical protein